MTRVGVLAAATIVLASSCGVAFGDSGPDPSEVAVQLDDLEQRATDELVAIFDMLTGDGLEAGFASLGYAWCDRADPTYRVDAFGRFDQPDGRTSTEDDAIAARDTLVELGWRATDSSRWTDGIWASADRWHVDATRDDLGVSLIFYADTAFVPVRILGPCIEVPADREWEYAGFTPRNLDALVGGTGRGTVPTVATTDG